MITILENLKNHQCKNDKEKEMIQAYIKYFEDLHLDKINFDEIGDVFLENIKVIEERLVDVNSYQFISEANEKEFIELAIELENLLEIYKENLSQLATIRNIYETHLVKEFKKIKKNII